MDLMQHMIVDISLTEELVPDTLQNPGSSVSLSATAQTCPCFHTVLYSCMFCDTCRRLLMLKTLPPGKPRLLTKHKSCYC